MHARLRHNCVLNIDLFRCKSNIIDSPLCSCGKVEDNYHLYFSCPKYSVSRNELFNAPFRIDNLHTVDVDLHIVHVDTCYGKTTPIALQKCKSFFLCTGILKEMRAV